MIGTTEIMVISGAAVLLFGASALPKFARSIGQARKELKAGMEDAKETEEKDSEKSKE